MILVDVHCHLESEKFSGMLDQVIADAVKTGVAKLITCSIEPGQWPVSRGLAGKYPEVEFAWGIHPWYIRGDDFHRISELAGAKETGAVAIGEIGLDRKIERPTFELQVKFFEAQMGIAREIDLPVIIHCRGAFNELVISLKRTGMPRAGGVVHSFSGSAEIAAELVKYNLSFSLGGILTYRNSKKRSRMLKSIFPGRFLLETDSPDIPPVEAAGKVNVPGNIRYNLGAAAEMLGATEEEVADATTANAVKLFNLEL